jgi:hypothetical protein
MQVFFCAGSSGGRLTFRPSLPADYLNSPLREHILSSLAQRELNLRLITANISDEEGGEDKWIISDSHNPLREWGRESALEHWKCTNLSHLFGASALWNANCRNFVSNERRFARLGLGDLLTPSRDHWNITFTFEYGGLDRGRFAIALLIMS